MSSSYLCDECDHGYHSKKSLKSTKPKCRKTILISAVYVRKVSCKKDTDAEVKEMHDITTMKNYLNVFICTDITVYDKCFNQDGYFYQDLKSVANACPVDDAQYTYIQNNKQTNNQTFVFLKPRNESNPGLQLS